MGARSSRQTVDNWDYSNVEQYTGLSTQQIQQLQQEFSRAAGRDGVLDRNEFVRVYFRLFGDGSMQNVEAQTARVFQTFDRDRSGTLSFDEFLNAIVMMNRNVPRRDRIDYLIRQNNAYGRQQGDGRIPAQYGHQVFRRLNDYYGLPPGTEHQAWKQVDPYNRGYVTPEEFMNYISQQQAYNQRYN